MNNDKVEIIVKIDNETQKFESNHATILLDEGICISGRVSPEDTAEDLMNLTYRYYDLVSDYIEIDLTSYLMHNFLNTIESILHQDRKNVKLEDMKLNGNFYKVDVDGVNLNKLKEYLLDFEGL